MIGALCGRPVLVDKNTLLIFAGGVGYEVRATEKDVSAAVQRDEVMVYTVFCLRQDKIELFGFLERADKDLFGLFVGVDGVGAKTALAMLSSKDLVGGAVSNDDPVIMTQIPGIGKKTAEKLLVELRNNKKFCASIVSADDRVAEAVSALVNLGMSRMVATRLVQEAVKSSPESPLEDLIRSALALSRV